MISSLSIRLTPRRRLLRARSKGMFKIDYRPKEYDPEDYDNEEDYYARAGDWMGNWGEAIDMWAMENIPFCKYLTIRVKGAEGGEENKPIMDWHDRARDR